MKKFISILLSLMMVMSMGTTAFATDDYETLVTYTGEGVSEYRVTVPATLAPGDSGTVKVSGTWASNMTVEVTAPDTVTLTNDIDGDTKILGVDFDGISQAGDNTNSILVSETISIEDITNALFGTWSGTIVYSVTTEEIEICKLRFGNLYHWDDPYDDSAYVFFEDGSFIMRYGAIYNMIPAGTAVYSGDTIYVGGTEFATILDDGDILNMSGNEYINEGDSNLIIEDNTIYNTDKTVLYAYGSPVIQEEASSVDFVIPQGVAYIQGFAFNGRECLRTITIPASVTSIGGQAFTGADNITDVYYEGTEEQWNALDTDIDATIHYNCEY